MKVKRTIKFNTSIKLQVLNLNVNLKENLKQVLNYKY